MKPTKRGQIVKFHTPYEDEDPNQLYVTLEVIKAIDRTRIKIYPLVTGLAFPPINIVLAKGLEVDEFQTTRLGYYLKYIKGDIF